MPPNPGPRYVSRFNEILDDEISTRAHAPTFEQMMSTGSRFLTAHQDSIGRGDISDVLQGTCSFPKHSSAYPSTRELSILQENREPISTLPDDPRQVDLEKYPIRREGAQFHGESLWSSEKGSLLGMRAPRHFRFSWDGGIKSAGSSPLYEWCTGVGYFFYEKACLSCQYKACAIAKPYFKP